MGGADRCLDATSSLPRQCWSGSKKKKPLPNMYLSCLPQSLWIYRNPTIRTTASFSPSCCCMHNKSDTNFLLLLPREEEERELSKSLFSFLSLSLSLSPQCSTNVIGLIDRRWEEEEEGEGEEKEVGRRKGRETRKKKIVQGNDCFTKEKKAWAKR